MKSKMKLGLGEITVSGIVLKDINIELEMEHSIGEIKGVIEITKNLPQDLLETYKNFCNADREATELETVEEEFRKSKGLTYSSESKSIVGAAFEAIKQAVSGNISEELSKDETLEKK